MGYSEFIIQHCTVLADSFWKLTGNPLIEGNHTGAELAERLYNAPFVIVSHGTETDPVFNYANRKAQELWEMDWEEFTKMPSRLSAEALAQSERQILLDKAKTKGYIDEYNGIRISKSGKRFRILNTILWNLSDQKGDYYGQAAVFSGWEFIG